MDVIGKIRKREGNKMKRIHSNIIALLVALIVTSLTIFYIINYEGKDDIKDIYHMGEFQEENITARIESILPKNWIIESTENNVTPSGYYGSEDCLLIHLKDPSTVFFESFGEFYYTSFLNVWFCPPGWNGERLDYDPTIQAYSAIYLTECEECAIYTLSLGNTTAPYLEQYILKEFGDSDTTSPERGKNEK